MKRRTMVVLGASVILAGLLAGCGFKLRGSNDFAFKTIAVVAHGGAGVASELRRSFGDAVQVLADGSPSGQAQVVLDVLQEQREKVVVGMSASGQVREFQLRIRVKFRLRTPQGKELIPETEILQQRDISYSETAALAKETEEGMLYRNMQTDIVQQLLRRLAALKQL